MEKQVRLFGVNSVKSVLFGVLALVLTNGCSTNHNKIIEVNQILYMSDNEINEENTRVKHAK